MASCIFIWSALPHPFRAGTRPTSLRLPIDAVVDSAHSGFTVNIYHSNVVEEIRRCQPLSFTGPCLLLQLIERRDAILSNFAQSLASRVINMLGPV